MRRSSVWTCALQLRAPEWIGPGPRRRRSSPRLETLNKLFYFLEAEVRIRPSAAWHLGAACFTEVCRRCVRSRRGKDTPPSPRGMDTMSLKVARSGSDGSGCSWDNGRFRASGSEHLTNFTPASSREDRAAVRWSHRGATGVSSGCRSASVTGGQHPGAPSIPLWPPGATSRDPGETSDPWLVSRPPLVLTCACVVVEDRVRVRVDQCASECERRGWASLLSINHRSLLTEDQVSLSSIRRWTFLTLPPYTPPPPLHHDIWWKLLKAGEEPGHIDTHHPTPAANERRAPLSTKDRESGASMTGVGAWRAAVERRGRASGGEQRFKDEEGGMLQTHQWGRARLPELRGSGAAGVTEDFMSAWGLFQGHRGKGGHIGGEVWAVCRLQKNELRASSLHHPLTLTRT